MCLDSNIATSATRIGILHHVDHGLFDSEIHLHGEGSIEAHSLTHLVDKRRQFGNFLRIVRQNDAFREAYIALLLDILNSHHRQVVALLSIAYKLVDGISHYSNQLTGFLLMIGEGQFSDLVHALHLEQCMSGILCLSQTVSKEENSSTCEDLRLLQRVFPRRHETCRNIRIAWQHAYALAHEQRCIVTCIAIAHAACRQVKHTDEESDKHIGFVHVGHRGVESGYNTVGHRLMGRDSTEYRTGDCHEERRWHTLT